jgi:hypothetical protein
LLVLLVFAIAYFRLRRVRRWEKILTEPASEIAEILARKKGRPRWVKRLPENLKLGKGTFFEALYAHFDARPEIPISGEFDSALSESKTGNRLSTLEIHAPMNDEDRIKSLLAAPSDPGIGMPSEALAQNLVLHLVNVLKGKQKLTQGLEHAVWDSLAPGGGFAGAKLGGAIGLAVAPFMVGIASVFTPVTVIAGAWLGAWTGKRVGARFKARRYLAVFKRLRKISREFQKWFVHRFPTFLEELDRDYARAIDVSRKRYRESQGRMRRLFYPNLLTVFCKLEEERLRRDHADDRKQMKRLLAIVRAQDPIDFASVLPNLNPTLMKDYPEFKTHRDEYVTAMKEFEEIRTKELSKD